jgi:hypothetical protein
LFELQRELHLNSAYNLSFRPGRGFSFENRFESTSRSCRFFLEAPTGKEFLNPGVVPGESVNCQS